MSARPWHVWREWFDIYGGNIHRLWTRHSCRTFAEESITEYEASDRARGLQVPQDVRYRVTFDQHEALEERET